MTTILAVIDPSEERHSALERCKELPPDGNIDIHVEFNYLIKGHLYYFELKKEKFTRQIKHFFDVLPNANELINLNKSNKTIKKNNHEIKPIFIIGVSRCGSTLIEKIIASGSKYIPTLL